MRDDKSPRDAHPQLVVHAPDSTESTGTRASDVDAALAAVDHEADRCTIWLDGHQVRLTSLNKVMWPAWDGRAPLSKRDLIRYCLQISQHVLPHLRDRPVTMVRFPNGIRGSRFYQKAPGETAPPFVQRFVSFSEHNAGDEEYFVCNNAATLLWLAQLADLELHVTHTRITNAPDAPKLGTDFTTSLENVSHSTLDFPDYLVTDIDPYIYSGEERPGGEPELNPEGFARAREVAHWYRELLDEIGLRASSRHPGRLACTCTCRSRGHSTTTPYARWPPRSRDKFWPPIRRW